MTASIDHFLRYAGPAVEPVRSLAQLEGEGGHEELVAPLRLVQAEIEDVLEGDEDEEV